HTQSSYVEWTIENTLRSELGEKYPIPFVYDNPEPPQLTVIQSNDPMPGLITLAAFSTNDDYLLITQNNGNLLFSEKQIDDCYDFKRHPDGTYTYFHRINQKFYQLDSSLVLIDSFYCGNGYQTDLHELIFAPNGNVLLMSYDTQILDMSKIVPGGDTAAKVVGLIIQEIDRNRNVVFQWRSWDHFEITDATHIDFTSANIDYVHGNAIEVDNDGNLMISSRHMDEITKINRITGDIIWRLGGKNNEFAFINDPIKFSHQHDIRRIANGNITLYDNGNYHSPQFSRAVEYQLDEVNKTATLVWQYRNSPDIYGFAMGSARRLPNGNTLIGWGYTSTTLTEVTPSGDIALEMKLPPGTLSYRVFKSEYDIPTNILTNLNNAPQEYLLSQNYPNPFNPATMINYSIPVKGQVTLKVFDIMGREVAEVYNGVREPGNYSGTFDGSRLSIVIYIYSLVSGDFTSSHKMILLK